MYTNESIREALSQSNEALKAARELTDRAQGEGRELTPEEDQKHTDLIAQCRKHKATAERMKSENELQADLDAELAGVGRQTDPDVVQALDRVRPSADSLEQLVATGSDRVREMFDEGHGVNVAEWTPEEHLRATNEYSRALWATLLNPAKAAVGKTGQILDAVNQGMWRQNINAGLQSDSDPDGGYLVAGMEFVSGLLKAADQALPFRQYARTFRVRNADSLGVRKRTAKASSYSRGSELQPPTPDTSLKFGKKVLTPHYWTAQILLSRDLIRRAVMPIEQIAREEILIDVGEGQEQEYVTGTGDQQPLGIFTASDDGISTSRDVSTGNTTTAITFDGLKEAKYAVLRYWRNVRWMFHPDAHKMLSKIQDNDGQYIWQEAVTENDPDRLLGFPVHMHESFPNTFTSGQYVGILGDFSHYWIADALDLEVQRLNELYAETNQIGLIFRGKNDAMPVLEEAFARVTLA